MLRLLASVGLVAGLCAGAMGEDELYSTLDVQSSYGSADFNCIVDGREAQVADDFEVPSGETWGVEKVVTDYLSFGFSPPAEVQIEFFVDVGGEPSDTALASLVVADLSSSRFTDFVFGLVGTRLTATLPASSLSFPSGRYWVTMQPMAGETFYSIRDSGMAVLSDAHARDVSGAPVYGHTTWEPLEGSMSVGLIGTVSRCAADFNGDGAVNTLDVLAFLNAWAAGDSSADMNGDGTINTLDVLTFLNLWNAGC